MPLLPRRNCAWAYDFACNEVPGVHPYEEPGYWRDIGTLDAYHAAQRDVLGPSPRFSLANPKWPIRPYRLPEIAQYAKPKSILAGFAGKRQFDPFGTHVALSNLS
jgi:glucose-1-phosphate adenylyltransferase